MGFNTLKPERAVGNRELAQAAGEVATDLQAGVSLIVQNAAREVPESLQGDDLHRLGWDARSEQEATAAAAQRAFMGLAGGYVEKPQGYDNGAADGKFASMGSLVVGEAPAMYGQAPQPDPEATMLDPRFPQPTNQGYLDAIGRV